RVAAERPRRRELAQLVPDHLLRDEHGHVLAAVVNGDRVPDHLGEDRRGARPGADHRLLARLVHRLDPAHQPFLHERPLLARPRHLAASLLAAAAAADDQLVRFLVLAARALAERRHTPRRHRVATALRLALASAVGVVDGVHRGAADRGALAAPAATAGLAAGDVLVVDVPYLTDRRPARERHAPHLAGRQAQDREGAVLRDELDAGARRARHLCALAGL